MTTVTQAHTPVSAPTLASELRGLMAVMRREWSITFRYKTWIIMTLIWPVIFPMVYILTGRALAGPDGSGLGQFLQSAGTDSFIGYIAVGTTVWMWQNVVLWDLGFALRNEQMRGTLESNWLTPTWRFSLLIGSGAVKFVTMLIFIVVATLEFRFFFGVRLNGSLWQAILVMFASVPSIYGIGITFASLVITAKEANMFVFLVRGLVMIFCGITFPVSILPGWMQGVAKFLPQSYTIRAMRTALLNGGDWQLVRADILALLGFGVFWLLAGYLLFTWMDRRTRKNGSLGHY